MTDHPYPDLEHVQPLPWRAKRNSNRWGFRVVDANGATRIAQVTEQEACLICEAVNNYHRLRKLEEVARRFIAYSCHVGQMDEMAATTSYTEAALDLSKDEAGGGPT